MFISALITIAKTWKQPKCPRTDERIEKMWYTYTMEYYSAIKKNKRMPFAAIWMELETLILSEGHICINPLSAISFANIFSHSLGSLFVLSMI